MKVKRKVAALLALAMVLTSQPFGVLADGVDNMKDDHAVTEEDVTTPSDADESGDNTETDDEEKVELEVTVTVDPEDGANVRAPKKVDEGDTLEFSVKVKDDYRISRVEVFGEELEGEYNEEDDRYYYEVEDVDFAPEINVSLEEVDEVEYPEFEDEIETDDGLVFEVSAKEGVLPEGTEVEVIPLDEVEDIDADAVKTEVLKEAGADDEEEELQYSAYRIELRDAEGNILTEDDINGSVEVKVSVPESEDEESESAEIEVYKVEVETAEPEEEAEDEIAESEDESTASTEENTTAKTANAISLNAVDQDDEETAAEINAKKTGDSFDVKDGVYNVSVLAAPETRRAGNLETITVDIGSSRILEGTDEGWFGEHKWHFANENWEELRNNPDGLILDKVKEQGIFGSYYEVDYKRNLIIPDNESLAGNTYYVVHKYTIGWNDTNEERFIIKISEHTEGTQAFFYIERAEYAGESSGDSSQFMYMGEGRINKGDPDYDNRPSSGQVYDGLIIEEPSPDQNIGQGNNTYRYDNSGYPILTLNNIDYYCVRSSETPEDYKYTYDYKWDVYKIANGSSDWTHQTIEGHETGVNDWHVDGLTTLYSPDEIQITVFIQNADSKEFERYGNMVVVDKDEMQNKAEELKSTADNDVKFDGYNLVWYVGNPDEGGTEYSSEALERYANDNDSIELYAVLTEETKEVGYSVEYTYGDNGENELEAEAGMFTGGTGTFEESVDVSGYIDATSGGKIPSSITVEGKNYVLDPENDYIISSLSADETENVITVNYLIDEMGGTVDKPGDGEPDKYQRTVVFKVDKGYWNELDAENKEDNKDKTEIVTLKTAGGDYDLNATVTVDVPGAGERPEDGYMAGGWSNGVTEGKVEVSADSDNNYTYTYVKSDSIKYSVEYTYGDNGENELEAEAGMLTGGTGTFEESVDVSEYIDVESGNKIPSSITVEGKNYVLDPENDYTIVSLSADEAENVITVNYVKDENEDGIVDSEQIQVIFDLGEESGQAIFTDPDGVDGTVWTVSDDGKQLTYWASDNGDGTYSYPETPDKTNNVNIPADLEMVIAAWKNGEISYPGVGTAIDSALIGGSVTYTADWDNDANHDNIPDRDQPKVTVNPYSTTVYSGGTNSDGDNSGFPDKVYEVTFEDAADDVTDTVTGGNDREVLEDAVTALTIKGVELPGKIDDYLQIEYVVPDAAGNYQIRDNGDIAADDEDDGNYLAVVMVKDTAKEAFPESEGYISEGGFIKNNNNDGRYVTLGEKGEIQSIGITAQYGEDTDPEEHYFVNFKEGEITVRYANNNNNGDDSEVYRDIHNDHAAVDTESDTEGKHAEAVIETGATFYTNGDKDRVVDEQSAKNDIKLFVDDVKDEDNRIELLQNKAFDKAYEMTAEQAEAAGYNAEMKYFDLVDSGNGNAWVMSSEGTDVYWPYPEGTDRNTEFELIHFAGLDRSTTYNGEGEVSAAIENADSKGDIINVTITNEEQGIRFHTAGEHAFSPFVLMWKESSGGNNNGGTSSPGAGPGASGSSYTAGVDGHWVHMSPEDINVPLTVPVPEGATPVTNPEWHQWKFFLNNGDMLYDQWAYVYNPYAVGDQPREGWFSFAENGIMEYGWYLDVRTGKWYWMHRTSDGMLGTMLTGWHYDDQDGKWYYLSPETGEMLLGWQQIDGVWYYFNPYAPEVTWVYDEATGGWTWNGSASRPYGSMYVNEMTPDGYYVDEYGAWRN